MRQSAIIASGSRSPIRAANYKSRKEDPIILIGHSLGADAVMQMAAYLNRKNIPAGARDALRRHDIVFDSGKRWPFGKFDPAQIRLHAPGTWVPRLTSLANVDVSADSSIDHINIDKSPRLHARGIKEVLAVVKGHRMAASSG